MKKKITNSSELNNYYKLVNNKLKKYSDMEIPADKIAKYLRPGTENFTRFISEDDDLKDVDGIEVVLKDVIQDTLYAFRDNLYNKVKKGQVVKFENFTIDKSIFKLNKGDRIKEEMAIADIYKISLSYIILENPDINMYAVNDNGETRRIIILTKSDIESIRKEIVSTMKGQFLNMGIDSLNTKMLHFKDLMGSDHAHEKIDQHNNENDVILTICSNIGLDIKIEYKNVYNLNNAEYHLFEIVSD